MKNIALIVAMQKELELFASSLQNFHKVSLENRCFYQGNTENLTITAAVSNIGKVNAALCAADLIRTTKPDLFLNIGISGGLDSSLNIGDFVIGSEIVYHDVWCLEPNAYGQVQDFPARYFSAPELCQKLSEFRQGLICCGDKFISTPEELSAIKEKFPEALAVDMESAAIAQCCYIHNVPFFSIRQISDTPGVEHHAKQYEDFWQNAPQNSNHTLMKILEKL